MRITLNKNPERVIQVSGNAFPIGFVLFCIFLVLKLTGVITWSWWWVTSPLWLPFAFIVGIAFIIFAAVVWVEAKRMDDLQKQAKQLMAEMKSKNE